MRALWVACELSPLKLQDAASFPLVRAMMKFLASLTAAQSFFIVYNITSRTSPQSRRYGFVYCVQRKKRAQSGTAGAYDDENIFGIPALSLACPQGGEAVFHNSLSSNVFQVGSTILIGLQSTLPLLPRYADNRMMVPLRSAVDLSTKVFSASKSDYQCHDISSFQQTGLHAANVGMPHGP